MVTKKQERKSCDNHKICRLYGGFDGSGCAGNASRHVCHQVVIWNGTRCPSPSTLSLDGGTRIMPTHRPTPNALDWKRICGMCAETSSSTEWRIKFINSWDESVNQWVIVPRRTIQSNWAGEKEREMAWMIFVVVIRRYHLIFDRARKPQKREGSIVSRSIRFLDLYMLFSLMNKSFILHKFIAIRRLRRASFLFFFFLVIFIFFFNFIFLHFCHPFRVM